MRIEKIRGQENGLVPAGRYFEKLAQGLRQANAKETARRERLNAQDRQLEARHRRPSAAHVATSIATATHAPM